MIAYDLSVQRSSVVLVIAFSMLSGYTVVTTNVKENGSIEQKNLCAQVPLSLHAQVCEAGEAADWTAGEHLPNLLAQCCNLKKNRGTTMSREISTTAFRVSEYLSRQIKARLERKT